MEYRTPNTVTELLEQAGIALAKRDPERLEELSNINEGWMQGRRETDAIRTALHAMMEAADLLVDQPTELDLDE